VERSHVAVISADASPVKPKLDSATASIGIGSLLLSCAKEQVRRIRRHQVKKVSQVRGCKQCPERMPFGEIT